MTEQINGYQQLAKINVNHKTEKKGRFTYLSWAFAVDELMKADPTAYWSVRENKVFPDGTVIVSCDVHAFGKSMHMWLPVMDNRNQAIANPNARQISDSLMRCLVKAIAVHGLGLYIYAGEDLPSEPQAPQPKPKIKVTDDVFARIITALQTTGKDKKGNPISKESILNQYDLTEKQANELLHA